MIIRKATVDDLINIEQVHNICFPNSFSSLLVGKWHLLAKFYNEYLSKNPDLFLVAEEENGGIAGFCMGYMCDANNFKKDYLRHNFIKIVVKFLILLVSFKKLAWKKIFSSFQKKLDVTYVDAPILLRKEKVGDLLSICVLDKYKGKGVSSNLLLNFLKSLKNKGASACLLSVEDDNSRGIGFYKKNGFFNYKKTSKNQTILMKNI